MHVFKSMENTTSMFVDIYVYFMEYKIQCFLSGYGFKWIAV
jgi:hypothetical protein